MRLLAYLWALPTTLVGAVAEGERGFFFHIGDGVAVAEARDAGQPPVVSLPENGEYANETYFATGEHWREHLRVTSLPQPPRLLALMSDGAASFVMASARLWLAAPNLRICKGSPNNCNSGNNTCSNGNNNNSN